jgi:hypothetical protein
MRVPKYAPLRDHLEARLGPVEMTFTEIATLVGGLPPSAFRIPQWWSNDAHGHVQAAAWLGAQRRVSGADLRTEWVTFE